MFCLRSWATLLVFLTNAPPVYVLLFLTANYALQRPCVYCSLLLGVLVFSLFDFSADWFAPRWDPSSTSLSETATSFISGNATLSDAVLESASLALSAVNGTGGSLASAALDGVRRRLSHGNDTQLANVSAIGGTSAFEWLRGMAEKRQFRIPCVDVIVRL